MEGATIVVAVAEAPPQVSISRHPDGKIKSIEGYLMDLWLILQSQLKFNTTFVEASSSKIGEYNNGTWNGLIGDLQAKRADAGLINLSITPERKKVVDFSAAIDYGSSKLLRYVSGASVEQIDWLTYIGIFSWRIWSVVISIWIFASLSLALASKHESKRTYGIYFFILFGALTNQGCEIVPTGFQGRIIFITFFLMCVVLYATYTALITTHFTVESYKPINSLREALDSGFKITVVRGSMQHEVVLEVQSEENIVIRSMFQEYPYLLPSTPQQAIENTYDKMTLFLYDGSALLPVLSDNCSLRLQPPSLFQGFEHLPFKKGFQYKEILNRRIVRLMATGNLKKLALKWYDKQQSCLPPANVVPSLGLKKTMFAFLVLSSGIGLSLLILLIELYFRRKRNQQKQSKGVFKSARISGRWKCNTRFPKRKRLSRTVLNLKVPRKK